MSQQPAIHRENRTVPLLFPSMLVRLGHFPMSPGPLSASLTSHRKCRALYLFFANPPMLPFKVLLLVQLHFRPSKPLPSMLLL